MRPAGPEVAAHTQVGASAAADWRRLGTMLGLVALPVFVLDQLSKLYIVRHLKLFEQIDLIPNWLAITYTLNPGAAFSLFATLPPTMRVGKSTTGAPGAIVDPVTVIGAAIMAPSGLR